jgi:hypothetical protein
VRDDEHEREHQDQSPGQGILGPAFQEPGEGQASTS